MYFVDQFKQMGLEEKASANDLETKIPYDDSKDQGREVLDHGWHRLLSIKMLKSCLSVLRRYEQSDWGW